MNYEITLAKQFTPLTDYGNILLQGINIPHPCVSIHASQYIQAQVTLIHTERSFENIITGVGVMAHVYNSSTQKAEAREFKTRVVKNIS